MEKDLDHRFNELVRIIGEYNEDADFETLKAAFEFAKVAHAGEKRISGVDVITHPLETSIILASWKMDMPTIVAGLLHDTVEHGAATKEDIVKNFGPEISFLVEGVTKVSKIKLKGSDKELFVENLRRMFLAIAKDLRIVFLRLAERLDNLKTIKFMPEERRIAYAVDSLEIYAPLAERLGMWKVKTQIDDLAFEFAHPAEYKKVEKISSAIYKNAERRILSMEKSILKELSRLEIEAKVYGRKKGLYSLWKKLERPGIDWDFQMINDIIALRVLLNSVKDCYVALGVIHRLFKPVPHLALADFIAVPKPNGYRSIHTKVYGPGNIIVEVQIRTHEMHEQAEYGAAAHWAYSEVKSRGIEHDVLRKQGVVISNKLDWVKKLAEWQKEVKDNEEFLEAVKFDALSRRIFVFSPKGDVFDLPINATPVDYAYEVHTDLGDSVKGATVDGKIVPLNYKLQNGQVVEILKHKEKSHPNHDWLNFVITTHARREIKKALRKSQN